MGVDYTASIFYGARLSQTEYDRIYSLDDHVDAWYASLGLDFRGTDKIAFIETGAAAYSGEGGQLFIASKASLLSVSGRDKQQLSASILPPVLPPMTPVDTEVHEAV